MSEQLIEQSIANEIWREYDFGGRVYRINLPSKIRFRVSGTTHRVLDSEGVVHCAPAPGFCGCVVRWAKKEGTPFAEW